MQTGCDVPDALRSRLRNRCIRRKGVFPKSAGSLRGRRKLARGLTAPDVLEEKGGAFRQQRRGRNPLSRKASFPRFLFQQPLLVAFDQRVGAALRLLDADAEAGLVGVHVLNGLAGDAGVHRGLRDSRGQPFDEAGIKGLRDDVTLPEAEGLALIGGGNFGGHRLLGQRGEGAGGGKLHGLVDFRGVHVQRPAENVGC